MDEEEIIRRRESWQTKYNKRRALVLFLEIIANLSWISHGLFFSNIQNFPLWIFYYIIFIIFFLPGLVFVLYDFIKTRNMSIYDRMININAETEDSEFTNTIMKSIQFLFCFLLLILIFAFILLDFVDAFQLAPFFIAIFILAIATLMGAFWKMNTSWTNNSGESNPPIKPEDEYHTNA